ncbi:alpha/beta fold hydrolase [Flavimaricola marinus]|uniref:Arylesterase n=1 Tax=Flavimaricola marinus TaxID=1819565 RepID=A0A238LFH0_9RHOB|nr:alpha/beta hydrolase [Flavimaricola marinus]SMY08358.1 Arylesterase [Flavimaricola marinus]
MIWLVLIAILAAIIALPYVLEARRSDPDPREATGQFAELSQGRTHYQWIGPVRGPVVVAIHGLTTPLDVWEGVGRGLAGFGYRVLVYDLFGRGWSESVPGRQDAEFFVQQLEDLLEDQGLTDDVTLVGYSLGGAIATAFGARHPERVTRVILLAPAGLDMEEDPVHRFMRLWPVVGDWLHGVYEPVRMRAAILLGKDPNADVPDMDVVQLRETGRKGFFPAVLAGRRGLLATRLVEEHKRLGREDVPVVAIWAADDKVIPISGLGSLAQLNRNARQEVVEGAGHGMIYTHAKAVLEVLRDVLRESWGSR